MRRKPNKTPRLLAAFGLIFIGIIGCLFPIMPGVPMLLVGLYLLNPLLFKKWAHKLISKLPLRHQHRFNRMVDKFKRKK